MRRQVVDDKDAYDVMPLARQLFPDLTGGPRFWWTPSDPSFLADANNLFIIWDRVGLRLDFERRWENLFGNIPRCPALGTGEKPPHIEKGGEYWEAEGFSQETIERFGLGHMAVPDAWTIPVFDAEGKCLAVRARLAGKEKGYDGKYITLPPSPRVELFRAEHSATVAWLDAARKVEAGILKELVWTSAAGNCYNPCEPIIVCGEKKAIRLWQEGFTAYSSTGGFAFPWRWLPSFRKFARVYVLFDSSEWWMAKRIATLIGDNAYAAWLPDDVDEWFKKGGTPRLFREWLGRAEPMGAARAGGGMAINELPRWAWLKIG